jgi:hypothetical protein
MAITPVGNTGKTQDPFASINNILGIAGKAQELKVQGLQLQTAQDFQNFKNNFKPEKFIGPDGTVDDTAVYQSPEFTSLGPGKQLAQGWVQEMKTGQLANKTSLQSLDFNDIAEMRRGLGAYADDADIIHDTKDGRDKIADYYKNFGAGNPNRQKIANNFGSVVLHAPKGKLGDALYAQQLMAEDAAKQWEQQHPQQVTNARNQLLNRAPRTGEISMAPGSGAPGTSADINPPSSAVAGETTRTTGGASQDIELSNKVAGWQRDASANIDNYDRIVALSKDVQQGKLEHKLGSMIGSLGSTYNDERAELEQHLGIIAGRLTERSGSDSRAAEALKQLPTADSPTKVIANSMDFLKGMSRQDLALGRMREDNSHRTRGGMNGWQGEFAHATGAATPLMHEFLAQKSRQAQHEFLQRHWDNPKDAGLFLDHLREVQKRDPHVFQ